MGYNLVPEAVGKTMPFTTVVDKKDLCDKFSHSPPNFPLTENTPAPAFPIQDDGLRGGVTHTHGYVSVQMYAIFARYSHD